MQQNIIFFVNKQKRTGLKCFNDSKAFIEYSNDMDHTYKNIEEYNPKKKHKLLNILMMTYLVIKT